MNKLKERPILFSGPMIRAILEGRKTQTRRIVKLPRGMGWYDELGGESEGWFTDGTGWWHLEELRCPYGKPGDRLWVRETHSIKPGSSQVVAYREGGECGAWSGDGSGGRFWIHHGHIREAPGYPFGLERLTTYGLGLFGGKWRPSIHMPRWASRITLEIVSVRVERLHGITPADAKADGCLPDWDAFHEATENSEGWLEPEEFIEECEEECDWVNYGNDLVHSSEHQEWERDREQHATQLAFRNLWESINGPDSWDANPWVWVVEFATTSASSASPRETPTRQTADRGDA